MNVESFRLTFESQLRIAAIRAHLLRSEARNLSVLKWDWVALAQSERTILAVAVPGNAMVQSNRTPRPRRWITAGVGELNLKT